MYQLDEHEAAGLRRIFTFDTQEPARHRVDTWFIFAGPRRVY
jgi:hypothetical protein